MSKIAVFPGSFDPITKGHVNILNRGLDLFDKVIIAIGHNSAKKYLYSLEQRMDMLNAIWALEDRVEVSSYEGLTVDYCRSIKASYILRGLRSTTDFEYEKTIAQLNHSQENEIESIFLMTEPKYGHFHSSVVREIIKHGGDASPYIPAAAFALI